MFPEAYYGAWIWYQNSEYDIKIGKQVFMFVHSSIRLPKKNQKTSK